MLKEITVRNVIIGKQFDVSDNYKEFIKIVKEKNINVNVVEAGCKVNIERNVYFNVIWPSSKHVVSHNSINNNALVCKLIYKNFSMLFTGDIEEETEKILVSKYKNTSILSSNVLKVGHHGSKSSSSQEFLKLIKPEIALIGVGENNNFGHPNEQVIERLKKNKVKVYRTDIDGKISIVVNNKKTQKIHKKISRKY